KEINSVDDLKGLKIRMPGLGGEVIGSIGATPIIVPGSEVFTALQTGMIDATDWVSPYNDLASGIHKAAKYYYYPSWAEPQAAIELLINKAAWDELPADLQAILEEAARGSLQLMIDEYVYNNAKALQELQKQGVILKKFPDTVLAALQQQSEQVMDKFAAESDLNQRIWTSMKQFRELATPMGEATDKNIYEWR
ncbi:TRAP transporter substrate-binding protein DctP, partial [Pseudomonas sp. RL]